MENKEIEILKELIKIDSQCTKSNLKIIEFISNLFKGYPQTKSEYVREDFKLYNLIIKIPGKASNSPLVFIGHTDTVPGSEQWDGQEFNPIEKENKIYGLGSCDMKSGLACMIAAALNLKEMPLNDIYLIFDSDEELNGEGGKKVAQELKLNNARIIIPEPTSKKIIYKQKGCLDMEIETKGISLHSSKTNYLNNLKNNAVYKMNLIINKLMEYEKEIEKKKDNDLGSPCLNIGLIAGGVSANVVPNKCLIKISRRLIPSENIDEEAEKINKISKEIDFNSKTKIIFYGQPFESSLDGEFMDFLKKSSNKNFGEFKLGVMSAWTEAALFSKFGETFIFGPGKEELCHSINEYVDIEEVNQFYNIYSEIMNAG